MSGGHIHTQLEDLADPVARSGLTPSARRIPPRLYAYMRDHAMGMTIEEVAYRNGVTRTTVNNRLKAERERHDALSTIDLYRKLGWLNIPPA